MYHLLDFVCFLYYTFTYVSAWFFFSCQITNMFFSKAVVFRLIFYTFMQSTHLNIYVIVTTELLGRNVFIVRDPRARRAPLLVHHGQDRYVQL